jgi:propanol-preferring alcohol dehydrogenase
MVLSRIAPDEPEPLTAATVAEPAAGPGEVVIDVSCTGVCHTDLDIIAGRTPPPALPVILGHQVVGRIRELGAGVAALAVGDRVGVAWIASACGQCERCLSGRENLCERFEATGRDRPGGYAERMVARADFVYPIPESLGDTAAAPLLCAGAIGYRSLVLTGLDDGQTLGLTGFGASGHLTLQLARRRMPRSEVFVFARSEAEQDLARSLGAAWAGPIGARPPRLVRAMIDTTPVWRPVVAALRLLEPGGRLVVNAIRKEDRDREAWLALDYARDLWLEKEIKSVANVTRTDVREFLRLAAELALTPVVQTYPLERVNQALAELKSGRIRGAKVVTVGPPDRSTAPS